MRKKRIAEIPQKISKKLLGSDSMLIGEEIRNLHSFIFGIYVKTGSDNEPVSQNGISHLVEHILFKGTKKRSAEQMALDIENLGGVMNAYTARDHTCFYVKSMPKNFKSIFSLFQEMIYEPLLSSEQLEKEKNVITEEIKSAYDDPEDLAFQNLNSIMFKGSPFEKTILGTEESVKSIDRKKLKKYIDEHYVNEKMFYAFAGPVDFKTAFSVFNDGQARKGNLKKEDVLKAPTIKGQFRYEFKESLQQFHIAMGATSGSFTSEDRYALMMLTSILGAGMSSRLFRILREKNGLVYTVYSFTEFFKESGVAGLYCACNEKNLSKTMKIIKSQFDDIRRNGVSDEEMEKVKNQLLTNLAMSYDSLSGRMSLLARSILYNDDVILFDDLLSRFERVTKEEIREAAEKYFDYKSFNVSVVGSRKDFKL
ncbi:MAG: pitrilysin family protein [bacterium]|nr:pitrilysin family protein [bacterium]